MNTYPSAITETLYYLALALWLGGIVLIGLLAAPAVFRLSPSREAAGTLTGGLLRRLDAMKASAIALLAIAVAVRAALWEESVTTAATARYALLGAMALAAALSGLVLSPYLRGLRRLLGPIDQAPLDHPLRRAFRRGHGLSMLLMLAELGCGVAVLFVR
ncbi:MAG: DUF4149 domain-containing protein [Chloroflexi bacterium]|nr:DUF4149 domain-containing protein [Chloroflexota bacterium]